MPSGRVPRISRLMALAIRFEDLVRSGEMADFAEIAELGQVTGDLFPSVGEVTAGNRKFGPS